MSSHWSAFKIYIHFDLEISLQEFVQSKKTNKQTNKQTKNTVILVHKVLCPRMLEKI